MKNEALRLFLAVTALVLTALLTNPLSDSKGESDISQMEPTTKESATRKIASDKPKKSKSSRTYAFFYRR